MSFLPKNIRTRLTLWYVLALTFILLLYAGVSITLVYINLRNNLDDQLQQDYEIVENLIRIMPNGTVHIDSDDDPYFHERWFQIWSADWKLLYESRSFTGKILPPISKSVETTDGFHSYSLQLKNNVDLRVLSGKINIDGKWLFIRLVRDEESLWNQLSNFMRLMLIALPVAIILAGFGGYFLTKKFLSPIDEIADKARRIGEENLKERLPVINPDDEFGNLARVFNEMLERIQKSFVRLKRFTSDAAHELRTPLTAIRSIGEVALQDYKDAKYYREIIGSMLEENRQLTHLVDNLLFLSRTEVKNFKTHLTKLELKSFTQETVEFINVLAEEKKQTIIVKCESEIIVNADRTLLQQALLNLLDNAIKYSPENSEILVKVNIAEDNSAVIEVKDNGPGIPGEHLVKIFERFYRVDKGRSREMGGSGLGLAIARRAITAQGGTLTVKSEVGVGSSFKIIL
ncbi:signal transduction histidine-protein kinase ArlS [bacterium BMS3Abin04]|nr:signal transduction histidine-protein kinase ArlS [bacterium BMS3Abin04]